MLAISHRLVVLAALLALGACATTPRPQSTDPLVQAGHFLRETRRETNDERLLRALDAARLALPVAADASASADRRSEAIAIYNTAVARCVAALDGRQSLDIGGYSIRAASPGNIDRWLVAEDIPRDHFRIDVRRPGFGGALVGVMDGPATASPNRPPKGYAIPWTAVATFAPAKDGRIPVEIRFLDPRTEETVRLAGARRPLAGDFTAPAACYPHPNEILFGLVAMLRSDRSIHRSGLLFYEPYDPNRTPVLFVHGLMSSPHVWLQVVNELNADPGFRRRYQIWSYFYPTGAPIGANALALRQALAGVAERHPLRRNLVVVGHSMGGILTRMQITDTEGRRLWDTVFRNHADATYAALPPDSMLKQVLIYEPNPHISRVVFIATPHRGSRLATLRVSSVGASLIRMPVVFVRQFNRQIAETLRLIDPSVRSIPTSVKGLSPNNRLLHGVDGLRMSAPVHSIIGNRGRDDRPAAETSDGIVPYWSSHLPAAESEILVPTGHDAFNHPRAIAELRRILHLPPAKTR
jgi:hypothetical protein